MNESSVQQLGRVLQETGVVLRAMGDPPGNPADETWLSQLVARASERLLRPESLSLATVEGAQRRGQLVGILLALLNLIGPLLFRGRPAPAGAPARVPGRAAESLPRAKCKPVGAGGPRAPRSRMPQERRTATAAGKDTHSHRKSRRPRARTRRT